uniref:Uncharacterized protein n=3 Tax=Equus TaxID=9789 RepID=A0A9L0IUC1_EQUAS|nr:retinitis pigmentosa 9 protein-like isoform X1 [Equus asinus]
MSSRSGRDDAGAGGARRPREPPEQELQRRREQKRRRHDAQQLQQLKHLESFYEKPPPGLIKEDETKPEDCIPDVPGNEHAREFLAHAPTKGLWMPLGKEVKVMQCFCVFRFWPRFHGPPLQPVISLDLWSFSAAYPEEPQSKLFLLCPTSQTAEPIKVVKRKSDSELEKELMCCSWWLYFKMKGPYGKEFGSFSELKAIPRRQPARKWAPQSYTCKEISSAKSQ